MVHQAPPILPARVMPYLTVLGPQQAPSVALIPLAEPLEPLQMEPLKPLQMEALAPLMVALAPLIAALMLLMGALAPLIVALLLLIEVLPLQTPLQKAALSPEGEVVWIKPPPQWYTTQPRPRHTLVQSYRMWSLEILW